MYRNEGVKSRKLQEGQTLDRWGNQVHQTFEEAIRYNETLSSFSFTVVAWCSLGMDSVLVSSVYFVRFFSPGGGIIRYAISRFCEYRTTSSALDGSLTVWP